MLTVRHVILFGLLLVLGLGTLMLSESVSAVSIRQLLGFEKDAEEAGGKHKQTKEQRANATSRNTSSERQGSVTKNSLAPNPSLDFQYVQILLNQLGPNQRSQLLADKKQFALFIQNEANIQSVLSAALDNNADKSQDARFLVERGARNILADVYLNRLIESKIPEGFPTEEQIAEYYKNNGAQFSIGRRVHAWQIFIPIPENATTAQINEAKRHAGTIRSDLASKKATFEKAVKHSSHEPSRNNGGYMGLLEVSELLPEVREPLMSLKEGEISRPIKTDSGFHIVRRGTILEETKFPFESMQNQIRRSLNEQLQAQLRQAIYKKAKETYPVSIGDEEIEEWRLRFKTESTN